MRAVIQRLIDAYEARPVSSDTSVEEMRAWSDRVDRAKETVNSFCDAFFTNEQLEVIRSSLESQKDDLVKMMSAADLMTRLGDLFGTHHEGCACHDPEIKEARATALRDVTDLYEKVTGILALMEIDKMVEGE